MAYRMTGARQRALRKAQLISARKRKRHFGLGSQKKLSKSHKRAIAVAAGGALVAGGVYGTSAWMDIEQRKAKVKAMKSYRDHARWRVNARRLERSPNMSTHRNLTKDAFTNEIIQIEDNGKTSTVPSRVVKAGGYKTHTRLKGIAADIMRELDGQQIPGRRRGAKYKVVFGERTQA